METGSRSRRRFLKALGATSAQLAVGMIGLRSAIRTLDPHHRLDHDQTCAIAID